MEDELAPRALRPGAGLKLLQKCPEPEQHDWNRGRCLELPPTLLQ